MFRGIETKNYTEAGFLRLPGMGRKSLMQAKAEGAEFKPAPDFDPAPIPRRVRETINFNPMHIRSHREESVGLHDYVTYKKEEVTVPSFPVDHMGNVLDGEENI